MLVLAPSTLCYTVPNGYMEPPWLWTLHSNAMEGYMWTFFLSLPHVNVSMGAFMMCSSFVKMGLTRFWLIKWVLGIRQENRYACLFER